METGDLECSGKSFKHPYTYILCERPNRKTKKVISDARFIVNILLHICIIHHIIIKDPFDVI